MKKNLTFYLYPVKDSVWSWHVDRLRRYWDIFTGRKLVVLALDSRTEDERVVKDEFRGLDCEITVTENDPKAGETKTFIDQMALLASENADEATFYAHGKGVSRKPCETANILAWSSAMYHMNLSDPVLVDRLISQFEALGCFRFEFYHAGSAWHFAGTYFWVRHSSIFSREWKKISPGPHGVEAYLGLHIPWNSAFCLTPPMAHTLYDRPVQHEMVLGWMKGLKEIWLPQDIEKASS